MAENKSVGITWQYLTPRFNPLPVRKLVLTINDHKPVSFETIFL